MDNKTQSLIQNLKNNQAALRTIMASRDGQTLMRQLTQRDGGASLQRAAQAASKGDTAELTQMISRLMESREGAELIQRISSSVQK